MSLLHLPSASVNLFFPVLVPLLNFTHILVVQGLGTVPIVQSLAPVKGIPHRVQLP